MTSDNLYLLTFNPEKKNEANLVLTPRQAICDFSEVARDLKEILRKTCLEKDIQIVAGKMTANYLHLFISYPEIISLKDAVLHIKKSSSEKISTSLSKIAGYDKEFWDDEYMALLSNNVLNDIFINDTINSYIYHMEQKNSEMGKILRSGATCKYVKCLVTGGAGFIGSNLVDELVKQNFEVVVIDDLSNGKIEYVNPQAKFYKVDINSEKVADIFAKEKFDFVFHLAAQIDVRKSVENPIFDNKVNVLGSLNILENCRKNNVKKLIFVSTGGAIYGETDMIPTAEDHKELPLSPYGIHKLTFEKYLNYYHKIYGLNYIVLRLANAYGPRQFKGGEAGVVTIFIDNAVTGKRSIINGDGTKTRDFVYVSDIVEAIISSLHTDYTGEINISSGQETTILNIVHYIEDAMGKSFDKEHGESKLGDVNRSCLANQRAKDVLKWQPKVGIKEGIKKTIEWAKSKN